MPNDRSSDDLPLRPEGAMLHLLGEDGIYIAGQESDRMPPQTTELLAYLALRDGRQARRLAITTTLWPDISEQAGRRRLSRLLWRANRSLPPGLVFAKGERIHLTDSVVTDWERAESILARAFQAGPPLRPDELAPLRKPLMASIRALV
ncbi:hypothetical protein [Streptomyces sp. NEAU-S7GS2]|uniref:hypothetical protein n=1 Tax=Streptomyces sp. NEAU-S7GS2 TaxID=2202000 RepID=UPI0013A57C4E|nr:hypothetical protein [Streptomyces sp. NEAU-S7GS2]